MMLIDLDEVSEVFDRKWFWSRRRIAAAEFRASDHLVAFSEQPELKDRVEAVLKENKINTQLARVCLLTQMRYFGFSMNPVSFFYCYAQDSTTPFAIIAEVNNTPWGEQHIYVVKPATTNDPAGTESQNERKRAIKSGDIKKDFHVSPFMSLDMTYQMAFSLPNDQVAVKIENHLTNEHESYSTGDSQNNRILDVTMLLDRRELSNAKMNWMLLKYPMLSVQVFAGIYWQAIRLYFKKIKFYSHPAKSNKTKVIAESFSN